MSVSLTIHARADHGVSDIRINGVDSKYAPSIELEDSTYLTIWDTESAYALQTAVNRVIAWYEDRKDLTLHDGPPEP